MEQAPIPTCIPYPYTNTPISLSCTVCDREIGVFVEFTKNFQRTFNTKENVYAILSGLGQSQPNINPSRKILMARPPPFSNICMQGVAYHLKAHYIYQNVWLCCMFNVCTDHHITGWFELEGWLILAMVLHP